MRAWLSLVTRPDRRWIWLAAGAVLIGVVAMVRFRASGDDTRLSAAARRGDLVVALTERGSLRPAEAITYRSVLLGRQAEITYLVAEGAHVREGDVLVRLSASEIERDFERAVALSRQAQIDISAATASRDDAAAELESLRQGERALDIEEAKARLQIAEKNVARLQAEYDGLKPLLDKGFITRDELDRATLQLEQAQTELIVMRKRVALMSGRTRTQEEQRAQSLLAQWEAQLASRQQHARDVAANVASLREAIDSCTILARHAGLVVHEEHLGSNPRRKIRLGDRVASTQGILTIPEVDRMLLDASVREADLWRVRPGLAAEITVDAFPAAQFTGSITAIGAVAKGGLDRSFEEKRFDVTIAIDHGSPDLRPDMTARARIVVAKRRGVVLVPVSAVGRRGDQWIVSIPARWGVEERRVTLGESDGVEVEIVEGVRDGERVSLLPSQKASGG